MKKTARAPSNIALIKYWGKSDAALRIPLNASLSMNLSGSYTTTTVEFSEDSAEDVIELKGGHFSDQEALRIRKFIDLIRSVSRISHRARIVTENTFPKGSGAASSASGFAALTVAGFAAAGLSLPEKELTGFARLGSGSACRSIPDGFVLWEGEYAYSLYPHGYWDIRDALVIVDAAMKKIPTSAGMESVTTSPLLTRRLAAIPARISRIRKALAERNFTELGETAEEDCLDMHAVMQSQQPPVMYWTETTRKIMDSIKTWRSSGLSVYFTIDAGANVHILYEGGDEDRVLRSINGIEGIQSVIVNKAAEGARCISDHLF